MKKLAIILSAVMVLAFAVPAMAADINFSGSLEASTSWNEKGEDAGFAGSDEAKMSLGLTAGENTKAVIEFKGYEGDRDFEGTLPSIDSLEIKKAYIETVGALWNGGNDLTARLGDLDVAYSPYVATHTKDGISVDGVIAGPMTVGGFFAWDGAVEAQGLNAKGSVEGIDLNGSVARHGEDIAWAIEGSTLVIDGVAVDAAYAMDMAADTDVVRVGASYDLDENTKVKAGYRDVDANFAPAFLEVTTNDDDERTDWVGENLGTKGINVGLETSQDGIDLAANYDDPTGVVDFSAATEMNGIKLNGGMKMEKNANALEMTETTFGAEKAFDVQGNVVTGKYNATIKPDADMKHEFAAEAAVNMVPELQGLVVKGDVTVVGTAVSEYNAKAEYTAPNGLELGLGYNNEDGANANAGIKVEF